MSKWGSKVLSCDRGGEYALGGIRLSDKPGPNGFETGSKFGYLAWILFRNEDCDQIQSLETIPVHRDWPKTCRENSGTMCACARVLFYNSKHIIPSGMVQFLENVKNPQYRRFAWWICQIGEEEMIRSKFF